MAGDDIYLRWAAGGMFAIFLGFSVICVLGPNVEKGPDGVVAELLIRFCETFLEKGNVRSFERKKPAFCNGLEIERGRCVRLMCQHFSPDFCLFSKLSND